MAVVLWRLSLVIVILASSVNTESSTTPLTYRNSDEEIRGNLSERRRERFIPKHDCTLRVYDADKEADIIRQWHELVKDPIDEETAMTQLLIEACGDEDKDFQVMCYSFLWAKRDNACVPGLTRAECVTIIMYTKEAYGFYREFNNASAYGVWAPYKVYTSLLYSAVKKLAAISPLPRNARLYRGMSVACSPPNATRIFWKTFTSTSLDPGVAAGFGASTFHEFQPHATFFGAQIKNLSIMSFEEEVLILPFEVFDFVKSEDQKFYFSASATQELLHGHAADHFRSSQAITMFTAIVSIVIVVIRLQQHNVAYMSK